MILIAEFTEFALRHLFVNTRNQGLTIIPSNHPQFFCWSSEIALHVLCTYGTNGFLPIGGTPDPSSQCIPKAPRCWHPASPNNCCKQLAANRPTLGPLSPASPLACMIALILALIEGEQQHGGDLPGIHSLTACPSEHASSTYLCAESE